MKSKYILLKSVVMALLFSWNTWSQTTIAQWNFNGADANSIPGGALNPTTSIGIGSLTTVGGVTAGFAAGVNSSSVGSSDPVNTNPPNFAWATTNYPALGTGNKENGIQINVSTLGFQGITLRFDQRLSNKTANTYVVQYTADRTAASPAWEEYKTFTFTPAASGTGDVWYNLRTLEDLPTVSDLDNNPNVAFRIVSAFDPTSGNYLASTSTSTYDPTGIVRFDMITVLANTTLSLKDFGQNKNDFVIYPNPVQNSIIHFNRPQDIKIFDILGKLVLNSKNTTSVNTSSLNAGIYMIQNETGITKKLIVK